MPLQQYTFENIVAIGVIAHYDQFLILPIVYNFIHLLIVFSIIKSFFCLNVFKVIFRRFAACGKRLTHETLAVNPFPHTTILQQTTLNVFCQNIENLHN